MKHFTFRSSFLTGLITPARRTASTIQWIRAACFLLIGLLLALLLQRALLGGLRRYTYDNLGIMNSIMRGEINADIVISGSSRAMYHYDPRIIEAATSLSCYNIGRNGTKLHEQLNLLNIYIARNKRPSYLIQNLDLASLQANDDITDPKQYIAWLEHDDIYRPLLQQKHYYFLYRWFPLVAMANTGAMRAAILGLLRVPPGRMDQFKGYVPQYLTWTKEFEQFKAQHSSGVSWTIDPTKQQTLEHLIETCQRTGIALILVYSPDYRDSQAFFRNRDHILHELRRTADRHNVPFWSYSDDPICGDKKYFYNSQHMNHRGATAFTRLLARRLADQIVRPNSAHARLQYR
jgi:hypothetical protein